MSGNYLQVYLAHFSKVFNKVRFMVNDDDEEEEEDGEEEEE